jgi:hypothetical protein
MIVSAACPSIVIELDVEAKAPKVLVVATDKQGEARILDWVRSQDALAELVEHALEIAEEARAA